MRDVRTAGFMTLIVGLVTFIAASCASAPGTGGDRNRLTAAQLQEVQASSLYHAVQQLRPQWLRGRAVQGFNGSSEVVVVQDGTVIGSVESLRQYEVDYATSLEYMDGTAAQSRIRGVGNVAGAIIIHTGRDGP